MLHMLKRHPIPIDAWFEDVLVLTYAAPVDVVAPLIPPGLELETHEHAAMLAVALVQTDRLRPAGMPFWTGQRFFMAGFRAFVRFRDGTGRTRRGLRILRSYADRRRMVTFGNLLTHYDYGLCDAMMGRDGGQLRIRVTTHDGGGDIDLTAQLDGEAPMLPDGSIFDDWRQARRFAGPLPLTFDHEPETRSIIAIRGVRERWTPRPVRAEVRCNTFVTTGSLADVDVRLCSAFHLAGVPYRWERGVRHPLGRSRL